MCPFYTHAASLFRSMQLIKLTKVLEEIDKRDENGKPFPFAIQFITADRSRNKGGKRIIAPSARACTNEIIARGANKIRKDIHLSSANAGESALENSAALSTPRNTRNIMIDGIDHPVSVHIRLIEFFNNQEVIY